MKNNTLRLFLILWLIICPIVVPPTASLQIFGYGNKGELTELHEKVQNLIKAAKKVSEEKENLRSFYQKWLFKTESSLDTVNVLRTVIINITESSNYMFLVGSGTAITGCTVGIATALAVPTGGLSLVVPTAIGAALSVIGIGISVGSSFRRFAMSKELCSLVVSSMETSKSDTSTLRDHLQFYFEAWTNFQDLFGAIKESKDDILKFYEAVQSEGYNFDDGINPDERTEQKLYRLFLQILEIDLSEIRPLMPAEGYVKDVYEGAKRVAEGIRVLFSELSSIIEVDPVLGTKIMEEGSNTHYEGLNENQKIASAPSSIMGILLGTQFKITHPSGTVIVDGSKIISGVSKFLQANIVGILAVNTILLSGELLVAKDTIQNIQEGSETMESKEILKVIDEFTKVRKEVVLEMKESFGW